MPAETKYQEYKRLARKLLRFDQALNADHHLVLNIELPSGTKLVLNKKDMTFRIT